MAISDGLKAHLEPRRPHKNVSSDPDTLQQEADRLLHTLLMELPKAGYEPLLEEVWTHIHKDALIGSWPFRKHVVAACHAARKKPAQTQQRDAAPVSDHKSMLALKVREKQPIAMAQLYGVLMAELVVAGEVNAQALEDLRAQGVVDEADGAVWLRSEALGLERELQQRLFCSADAREGMDANREKRAPSFRGA